MAHIGVDYRVSLLSAAAVHGSSHQAAMVFQVIAPKQLRSFETGHHRIQFVYQSPESFAEVNQPQYRSTSLRSKAHPVLQKRLGLNCCC